MKIAVIGGTGMVGSRIVAEAASRGHDVTAVSRSGRTSVDHPNVHGLAGDVAGSDLAGDLASEHDVVVSAIGPSREPGGDPAAFADTLVRLARQVKATRLIVVGGAGSLLTESGVRLVDTPGFPEEYKAEALAGAAALQALKSLDGLGDAGEWSYLSPAPVIAPGERSGTYRIGDEHPVGDQISAEDYAVALVDEIENAAHTGRRFTVAQ